MSLFIGFDRRDCTDRADLGEHLGNLGLGLLRVGLGKKVEVLNNGKEFRLKTYSLAKRVAAIALFLLLAPITVPLLVLGLMGARFSRSFKETHQAYLKSTLRPALSAEEKERNRAFFASVTDAAFSELACKHQLENRYARAQMQAYQERITSQTG